MSAIHASSSHHSVVAETASMVLADMVNDVKSFMSHPGQSTAGYLEQLASAVVMGLVQPQAVGLGLALKAQEFLNANTLGREQMAARGIASVLDDPATILTLGAGSAAAALSRFGVMAAEAGVVDAVTLPEVKTMQSVGGSIRGEAIGLTTRLNRSQIKAYLADIKDTPREQLVNKLQELGFVYKGGSKDGRFLAFTDKLGNLRVEIHPSDSVTKYHHIHILDKAGNSLSADLKTVDRDTREAHIEISDDYGYKPSVVRRIHANKK